MPISQLNLVPSELSHVTQKIYIFVWSDGLSMSCLGYPRSWSSHGSAPGPAWVMYCSASVWLHHSTSEQTIITNFLMDPLQTQIQLLDTECLLREKKWFITRNFIARFCFIDVSLLIFAKLKKTKSLQVSVGTNILVKFYWEQICHKKSRKSFWFLKFLTSLTSH